MHKINPVSVSVFFGTLLLLLSVGDVDGNNRNLNNNNEQSDLGTIYDQNRKVEENDDIDDRLYHIWDAQSIQERLMEWNTTYPEFVLVETSQEAFGLPASGSGDRNDCPFDEDIDGCYHYFVTIQDFTTHPPNSPSSSRLPEVLWSGALHGNERVGPTAVMEAANLLLLAASCEALKRQNNNNSNIMNHNHDHYFDNDDCEEPIDDTSGHDSTPNQKYCQCRKELQRSGIDDLHRTWLARLVSTRRLIVVPTANALGYSRQVREEDGMDPNRDFPYDIQDPTLCMQTIAARTLNEIFRKHLIQLSLTFHAGMEVIAYEWGAPSYYNYLSPDDVAQGELARAYSKWGGTFQSSSPYPTGTMNDLVYYVRGGMEDWAYAGSWDPDRVIPCNPTTYNGYEPFKTVYNNGTLRVFNMLVETSNSKTPTNNTLGSSYHVMSPNHTSSNGHISRNIRLALGALDLVQPYVDIIGINSIPNSKTDTPPTVNIPGNAPAAVLLKESSKTINVPKDTNSREEITIQWTVGGSLTIQETQLWYAKWEDFFDGDTGIQNLTMEVLEEYFERNNNADDNVFQKATMLGPNSGTGLFHPDVGPSPTTTENAARGGALGPVFQAVIQWNDDDAQHQQQQQQHGDSIALYNSNTPRNNDNKGRGKKDHEKMIVIASAVVDQNWKDVPNDYRPSGLSPQSHIVNARTNKDWYYASVYEDASRSSETKIVEGKVQWFSTPMTMILSTQKSSLPMNNNNNVTKNTTTATNTTEEARNSSSSNNDTIKSGPGNNGGSKTVTLPNNSTTNSEKDNTHNNGTTNSSSTSSVPPSNQTAVVTIQHLFYVAISVESTTTNHDVLLKELIGPYRQYIRTIVMMDDGNTTNTTHTQQNQPQQGRALFQKVQQQQPQQHSVGQWRRLATSPEAILQEESISLRYVSHNDTACPSHATTVFFPSCLQVQGQYDILLVYHNDDIDEFQAVEDYKQEVQMRYLEPTESGISDGSFLALVPNSSHFTILPPPVSSSIQQSQAPLASLEEDDDHDSRDETTTTQQPSSSSSSSSTTAPTTLATTTQQPASPGEDEEETSSPTKSGTPLVAILLIALGVCVAWILCDICILCIHRKRKYNNNTNKSYSKPVQDVDDNDESSDMDDEFEKGV